MAFGGGVRPWRGYGPGGVWHCGKALPPSPVDGQTSVKTLPSRNFVILGHLDVELVFKYRL